MHDPTLPLHCFDRECQAANPSDRRFCQQCNTPLVRRYLWAIGPGFEAYPLKVAIADRYLRVQGRWVLDTQPAQPPQFPQEVPSDLAPYLRLFPLRPHVPQIYGQLPPTSEATAPTLWLLEYGLFSRATPLIDGELLPALASQWAEAPPLRQLYWLWQMARLWPDFARQGVAGSLLTSELLRVNGSTLQLRELRRDDPEAPARLAQLADLWQPWLATSAPSARKFLKQLCDRLRAGRVKTSQQLLALLDRALATCGQDQVRQYDIFACTDTGPVRQHNEDACYPDSGKLLVQVPQALAIVCDGIGGHEGGEIASNLAIATLRDGVRPLTEGSQFPADPLAIAERLELSTCKANDEISDRNDSEQRQERRRMGTTLVMALSYAHEMYLTHVGDSRIYLISADSCQQLTLDDDVASREVRLGYALYRDAVTHPSAGALVQALGMSHSSRLRPTVRRLAIESDCVFLLCSDGLSDRDRVEQYWEAEVLPVLQGMRDVRLASERLMQIANQKNGHDNITIALVHCRVRDRPGGSREIPFPKQATAEPESDLPLAETEPGDPQATWPGWAWALLVLVGLMTGLSLLSYAGFPELRAQVNHWLGQAPSRPEPLAARPQPTPPSPVASPVPTPSEQPAQPELPSFAVGHWLAAREAIALHAAPQLSAPSNPIPADSLLYISQRQVVAERGTWLYLQVCPPDAALGDAPSLAGWWHAESGADQVEGRSAASIPAVCQNAVS